MAKRPFLWLGCKTWQAQFIQTLIPDYMAYAWCVPFAGALGAMHELEVKTVIAGDAVKPLINAYQMLKEGKMPVDLFADKAPDEITYTAQRDYFNKQYRDAKGPLAASFFWWLNRYCRSGQWRVNRSGSFNVPIQKPYRKAFKLNQAMLDAWVQVYKNWLFLHGDFGETVDFALDKFNKVQTIHYWDPPYVATFDKYTAEGFGAMEQKRLAKTAEELGAKGHKIIVCNSPNAAKLYPGAKEYRFEHRHKIGMLKGITQARLEENEAWYLYNIDYNL